MSLAAEPGKSEKKKGFASFLEKFKGKNKRSKKEKLQQQQNAQANGRRGRSPTQQSEKVPIVNDAGRDETEPMQRIPSGGGTDSNAVTSPATPASATAYTLPQTQQTGSFSSIPHANGVEHGSDVLDSSNKSTAPTLETNGETMNSEAGHSKNGGTLPGGGMSAHSGGGSNSVFSSSNHSSRSLTTTLTTIQSQAPSAHLSNAASAHQAALGAAHGHQQQPSHGSSVYFQHQYPTTPVVSAVPPHLQTPSGSYATSHLPTTYRSATANNLLTDNASILTLASSTQQSGRRNSLDTAASVRAIPPSSQWGGSRESLPLSMVSQTRESSNREDGGLGYGMSSSRPSMGGLPSQERTSIYSSQGNAPILSSERNSIYTGRTGTAGGASTHNTISDNASLKERNVNDEHGSLRADDRSSLRAGDGGSVRSGLGGMGHGRNDSTTNSIGGSIGPTSAGPGTGMANSPVIASSKDMD